MLHYFVSWYVKCVEKVPFRKSGHIYCQSEPGHTIVCHVAKNSWCGLATNKCENAIFTHQ